MGLGSDGTAYGLPPFEVEMRRRLWWQIVLLDSRTAEISGAGTAILTHVWTTKLPLNVNDSDLFPDMRDPPIGHPGLTEMVFVLLRCEAAEFMQRSREIGLPLAQKDQVLDEFEERIEGKYLKYCDPLVPLHLVSTTMARTAICKLRIGPRNLLLLSNQNGMPTEEKDKLFVLSLTMLENHNVMLSSKCLRRFLWHIYLNFPFPAHVYLLCALRYRTADELADQAWRSLADSFEQRQQANRQHAKRVDSVLHLALANLTVKAWEAREATLQQFSPVLPPPRFISELRQKIASKKPKIFGAGGQDSMAMPLNVEFEDQIGSSMSWLDQAPAELAVHGANQQFISGFLSADSISGGWGFWGDITREAREPQGFDAATLLTFYQP